MPFRQTPALTIPHNCRGRRQTKAIAEFNDPLARHGHSGVVRASSARGVHDACHREEAKRKIIVVEHLDRLSDEELLVATAEGCPDAFGIFYERHIALVLALFRQRTGSAEMAGDLAGETFAAALLSCRRFRSDGPPATSWLLGIAQNKLRESARRHRVETTARERLAYRALNSATRNSSASNNSVTKHPTRSRSSISYRPRSGTQYVAV